MRIQTICPVYISNLGGPSYVCNSLLDAMTASGLDVNLYCVSADNKAYKHFHRPSIPIWAKPVGYRLLSEAKWEKFTEWRYMHSLKKGDVAYIWDPTSIEASRIVKSAGHTVITECVNTHQATSKMILDAEYQRLGLKPTHGIDDTAIAKERSKHNLADYIFSPSDEVTKSLLDAHVPSEKIIRSSFGLDPKNILSPEDIASREKKTELTAMFAGRIGIRKGVHLLLEYWIKAGVKGKLKLVGNIEPGALHIVQPYLNKYGIEHLPFTSNLKQIYMNADIFLFPSLEEGSPLVTYLALGAGLPSIVSPMGGGGIIDNGKEGLIVEPHDAGKWVDSIRKLFSDTSLRINFSANAYRKAENYLWNKVGHRRVELLLATLTQRTASHI